MYGEEFPAFAKSLALVDSLIAKMKTQPLLSPSVGSIPPVKDPDTKSDPCKGGGAQQAAAVKETESTSCSKINFLVGKVLECARHPESEKLLVEKIDVGEAVPRTICSGIADHYSPEALVGKLVVIVANLEPRKLKGISSEGMVLCACNDGKSKVELIEAAVGTQPGTRIIFPGHVGPPEPVLKKKLIKYWEEVAPDLKTDGNGIACYQGIPFKTEQGPVKAATLIGAAVS